MEETGEEEDEDEDEILDAEELVVPDVGFVVSGLFKFRLSNFLDISLDLTVEISLKLLEIVGADLLEVDRFSEGLVLLDIVFYLGSELLPCTDVVIEELIVF